MFGKLLSFLKTLTGMSSAKVISVTEMSPTAPVIPILPEHPFCINNDEWKNVELFPAEYDSRVMNMIAAMPVNFVFSYDTPFGNTLPLETVKQAFSVTTSQPLYRDISGVPEEVADGFAFPISDTVTIYGQVNSGYITMLALHFTGDSDRQIIREVFEKLNPCRPLVMLDWNQSHYITPRTDKTPSDILYLCPCVDREALSLHGYEWCRVEFYPAEYCSKIQYLFFNKLANTPINKSKIRRINFDDIDETKFNFMNSLPAYITFVDTLSIEAVHKSFALIEDEDMDVEHPSAVFYTDAMGSVSYVYSGMGLKPLYRFIDSFEWPEQVVDGFALNVMNSIYLYGLLNQGHVTKLAVHWENSRDKQLIFEIFKIIDSIRPVVMVDWYDKQFVSMNEAGEIQVEHR